MTDEQRRAADIARRLVCTDDERRTVLVELEERRRVLKAERATIDEELSSLEATISGHRAALAN